MHTGNFLHETKFSINGSYFYFFTIIILVIVEEFMENVQGIIKTLILIDCYELYLVQYTEDFNSSS